MPLHDVGVFPARPAPRSGEIGQLKPGVIRKHMHEPLADHSRRSEHPGAKLFLKTLGWSVHASPLWEISCCVAGPIRVPRNSGLNVFLTQTTISVSAASGKTSACKTLAPAAASACA